MAKTRNIVIRKDSEQGSPNLQEVIDRVRSQPEVKAEDDEKPDAQAEVDEEE
jgi:hypothetical protein